MNENYTLNLTAAEMNFFRELFNSQLPVTIQTVEIIAVLKQKVLGCKPDKPTPAADAHDMPVLNPA